MSGWQHTTLGALCRFVGGQGFPPEYQGLSHGDVPFIKVSDMELPPNGRRITTANNWLTGESLAAGRFKPQPSGAIVFAKIGEAIKRERVRVLTRPTVIDNNMMAAIPEAVDSEFLFNLLRFIPFSKDHGGTSLPYLRQGDLAKIEAFVPPLEEQERIAGVLGAFDDLVETNRRLASAATSLQKAAFLRATRDTPRVAISEAMQVEMGQSPPGDTYNTDGVGLPFFQGVKDFGDRYPAARVYCSDPRRVAKPGDLLLAVRAPIGRVNVATQTCATGRGLAILRSPLPSVALQALTAEPDLWVAYEDEGTVFSSISRAVISNQHIRWTDDDDLARALAALDGLVLDCHEQNAALTRQRDELLPLLMSGRVRVREAEAAVS